MLHAQASAHHARHRSRALRLLLVVVLASLVAATLQLSHRPAVANALQPGGVTKAAEPLPALPLEKPNILLITTDDQTVADMAYMPKTRRLLGDEGATFTDAISSYPLCCPARATILTGQLSHNHGVKTNEPPYGGYDAMAAQPKVNSRTIGTWLQALGYNTMFTGKYLNGYGHGGSRNVVPPGWDEWYGAVSGTYNYFGVTLNENHEIRLPERGDYQTDLFGDRTRNHITESVGQNEPFFIWESNLAPHDACYPARGGCQWGPAMPAKQDANKFPRLGLKVLKGAAYNERVVTEKPANIRALRRWGSTKRDRSIRKHRMRVRSLQAVDRSVAETVGVLEDTGELDNTLIIFTSDNGYMLGQHRWQGKILPYEPSLRVPLLMRWGADDPENPENPDSYVIPRGVTRSQTTALVDLPATVADAAGVVNPALTLDGRSLLPIARGEAGAKGYGAMSIESGQQGWDGRDRRWFYRGVRTRRYTYVDYPRTDEVELYDRRKDPSQLNNVAYRPAYRTTRDALARKLRALKDCVGEECLDVSGDVPSPRPEPHLTHGLTVHPDELGSIGRSSQVVTLTGRNWQAGQGTATAWTRRGRTWTVARGPFRVALGAAGMAVADRRLDGSGKTPAGTFRPSFALGYRADPGTTVPYRRFDKNDYWVMDRRVPDTYNVYQKRRSAKAKWRKSAAERWWSRRARYPHALVLDYNLPGGVRYAKSAGQMRAASPADVRRGSFVLHSGARVPGRGWTSTRRTDLRWLLRWMRPSTRHTTFVVGTTDYLRGRL